MQQTAESKHQLRWAAVNYRQQHPSWTDSRIAAKIGMDPNFVKRWTQKYSQQNSVADSPKPGRPQKASTATVQDIVHMADSGSCYSSAGIAAQLAHETGAHLSCSTIARILSVEGLKHMKPQQIPLLTQKHKAARLRFASEVEQDHGHRQQLFQIACKQWQASSHLVQASKETQAACHKAQPSSALLYGHHQLWGN